MNKFAMIVGIVLIALAAAFGVAALSAAFFMIAVNYGVVHLVAAAGGTLAKIGFWTSFWTTYIIGLIGSLWRGVQVNANS